MLGFHMFRHAVLMLIDNLGPAFRVSLVPAVMVFGLGWLVLVPTFAAMASGVEPNIAQVGLAALIILVGAAIAFCWVAVGWHRYVLLEEEPAAFAPCWNGPSIKAYFLAGLRVVGMTILAAIPLGILMAILSGGDFQSAEGGPVALLFNILTSYLSIRWSLVLPAAAVGSHMRVGSSWRVSKPFAGAVFVAMICVNLLTYIPTALLGTVIGSALAGFAYFTVAAWLQIMLSISLLTALYGHIVEGRALR